MISTKRKLMTVFLCTSLMGNGFIRSARASDNLENQNDQQKEQTVVEVAKDIFFKGSIDGKHTWIVLGVEEGLKIAKEKLHEAVASDQLLASLKDSIYDSKGDTSEGDRQDILGAVNSSVENAKIYIPEILNSTWKSIEKIPNAFKVNLEQADDAYYGSNSKMVGNMKYSGWAIWTIIEGTYYLVIDTPVSSVKTTALSALGIAQPPFNQTLKITSLSAPVIARFVANPVVAAAASGYSLVSSTTAALGSLFYAGGLAALDDAKWMMYDYPRSYLYPISVELKTQMNMNQQEILANSVVKYWQNKNEFINPDSGQSEFMLFTKISRYHSEVKIIFGAGLTFGLSKQVGVFQVISENGKLKLRAEISTVYINTLSKAENRSYSETKAELEAAVASALNEILAEATHTQG